jgi:predicted nucleic acid-binding protein
MSKIFIDTNILVYSLDRHYREKQQISRTMLRKVAAEGKGVISTQVIQEFFVVTTKKLQLHPLKAKAIIKSFENFETITISPSLIDEAIDYSILNPISFWDALIVAAAKAASCSILLTEDFNHQQLYQGIRAENPYGALLSSGNTF